MTPRTNPWAIVAGWCTPLATIRYSNCFGYVMISIYDERGHYCYSVLPCGIDEIPTLSREEFLARVDWKRQRQEMPVLDAQTRQPLFPEFGLLGVRTHLYDDQATTLDEAMMHLLAQQPLLPGERLIAYRCVATPHGGRTRQQWKEILYMGPHPLGPLYIIEDLRKEQIA